MLNRDSQSQADATRQSLTLTLAKRQDLNAIVTEKKFLFYLKRLLIAIETAQLVGVPQDGLENCRSIREFCGSVG